MTPWAKGKTSQEEQENKTQRRLTSQRSRTRLALMLTLADSITPPRRHKAMAGHGDSTRTRLLRCVRWVWVAQLNTPIHHCLC